MPVEVYRFFECFFTIFFNSSIDMAGTFLWIIAWQFGQTGIRSFFGSGSYSPLISDSGFR